MLTRLAIGMPALLFAACSSKGMWQFDDPKQVSLEIFGKLPAKTVALVPCDASVADGQFTISYPGGALEAHSFCIRNRAVGWSYLRSGADTVEICFYEGFYLESDDAVGGGHAPTDCHTLKTHNTAANLR